MSLFGPFDRPVALRLLGDGLRPSQRPAMDHPTPSSAGSAVASRHSVAARLEVARFLTRALLADARTVAAVAAELEAVVDECVVVWSPALHTTSRTALISALLESDDAVSDIVVSIDAEGFGGSTAFVLWSLSGRFNNAGFLNDDVMVEPSYESVESAGVLVVTFAGSRAVRIDCFYDGVALLEQVLSGASQSRDGEP